MRKLKFTLLQLALLTSGCGTFESLHSDRSDLVPPPPSSLSENVQPLPLPAQYPSFTPPPAVRQVAAAQHPPTALQNPVGEAVHRLPEDRPPTNQQAVHEQALLPDMVRPRVQPASFQDENQLPAPLEDVPQPPGEPAHAMDLLSLESIAMQNSPALSQASARVEAARGRWVQQGLWPNVILGYSGQQLGSGGEATQQGVYMEQEFITGRKLRLNREVAAWEIEQAERDFNAMRLRVLTDVRSGYYTTLIAQRRRELAEQLVSIGEQGEQAAEALFRGKEVSAADPLRARIQVAEARIVLQNSINQHLEAWRRLAAVIGAPDMGLQRLNGDLHGTDVNLSWHATLDQVLSESPELAAALAQLEAARWSIRRARAEVIPNVDVQAIVQDDQSTNAANANLQVSLPIPIWNRNQGGIREARAQAVAAARAVDKLSLDLQARLAVAFQRYESARAQTERYSGPEGILANANRVLELVRTGYEAGEFSVLDLLNAQRTYFETNLAYLDSLRELWVSAAEIRGLLLNNSLTQ